MKKAINCFIPYDNIEPVPDMGQMIFWMIAKLQVIFDESIGTDYTAQSTLAQAQHPESYL